MNMKSLGIVAFALLIVAVAFAAIYCTSRASAGNIDTTISDTLVGTNMTYYSIAGRPMNYTITAADIGSITPTTYDGKDAWIVHVGQGLSWNLTMDASGKQILYVDQLFRT